MTILRVQELDLEGKRTFETSLAEGDVGTRMFLVVTDGTATEPEIVNANDGTTAVPADLSYFPGSSTAQCIKKVPIRSLKDTRHWFVNCSYKSIMNERELQRAEHPDPLDRKTRITGASRTVMVPMRRLLRTAPYKEWSEAGPGATWAIGVACNSATDPLDPPIEVPVTEWAIHAEKNVDTMPDWYGTYNNGVNDADQELMIRGEVWTIPKGRGKLGNFTFSDDKRENGVDFITIGWDCIVLTPRAKFGGETDEFGPWDEERLDEGTRTYNTSAGKWSNVRDKSGQSITTAVAFDGSGEPINVTGARIAQSDLWRSAYRPHGNRVDYGVMPWE